MARPPDKSSTTTRPLSPDRLWAEQLAMGMAMLVGLLIFMALFHPTKLSSGAEVLGPNDLRVYGWASAVGIILQVIVHEAGTLVVAWRLGLPLRFRVFGFGAHATAILEELPREPWRDAVVGFAGPLTGTAFSLLLAAVYAVTENPDSPQIMAPFFLGMACVGYFYNLITLVPILDLEGGWIAPAIAPQAWLLGVVASVLELTREFNLVLLCVVCFGLPRLILLISARAPQLDQVCTARQRVMVSVGFFALVIGLAALGSWTFDRLPEIIRNTMED